LPDLKACESECGKYAVPRKKVKEYIWSFEYYIAPFPEDPSTHLQSDFADYIPRVKNPTGGVVIPINKALPSQCIGKNICIICYLTILYEDGTLCSHRTQVCYNIG
jgi:hypothetical protein